MDRPQFVSQAISKIDAGLHVGQYGPYELRSSYQPIYRLGGESLEIEGFEGLIRPRQDGAPIPPITLFAAVDAPDRLFVESLCSALHLSNFKLAEPQGLDLYINVNPAIFSSFAVIEREFDFVVGVLPGYGLQAKNLVCEIVEEEALSQETLFRLRDKLLELGLRIAVDDFGAGSSSLARFRDLRPDVVKLDGAIFRRLADDPIRRRLLISMAQALLVEGSKILVEGIETEHHLAVAIDIGATLFQGYYLGRPEILPYSFPKTFPLPRS